MSYIICILSLNRTIDTGVTAISYYLEDSDDVYSLTSTFENTKRKDKNTYPEICISAENTNSSRTYYRNVVP